MTTAFDRFAGRCLALSLAAALTSAPAAAGTAPGNLSDIAHQSAEWGSEQMRFRGYTRTSSHPQRGRLVEYWWNGATNRCAKLVEADGNYESVATTSATDCGQYHAQATANDATAAAVIGAAALLGVVALAHNSHERDDQHGRDSQSLAEFDRGYRDGLYHHPYHNYRDTPAYSDGYNAGQSRRDEETRHRSEYGHHSGYHAYVSLTDLVGSRASSFDSEIRARGFDDEGGYKQGNRSITIWWNGRTRQCVQSVTKDGTIKKLEDIDEGNCT